MLPFASNCKSIPNRNGNLPWQLAQNPQIVKRLLNTTTKQVNSNLPNVVANHQFVRVAEKRQSE